MIFSVKNNILSSCNIYWHEGETMVHAEELGRATRALLTQSGAPLDILQSGTSVQFQLKDGTHVPNEEQIIAKLSSFYMLRLIAADPNTQVMIERTRADGKHSDALQYDFPIGEVKYRADDILNLGALGKLPISILVARSDVPLDVDPINIERRGNGLLFVDDNDAVLDLTLLPEGDKNPLLKHVYGIVRITGLRDVLEAKLEDADAEAVLTTTRDGFDKKSDITERLFKLVERHVRPVYEAEEKHQKKGDSKRSEALDKRVNDVLKALNQFNAEETDDSGEDDDDDELRVEPIYFGVESLRLRSGVTRRLGVYVNLDKVKTGEIVLFESDNSKIKIEPESSVVGKARKKDGKNQSFHRLDVTISCDEKGTKGKIIAVSLDKEGNEVQAELRVLGVDEALVFEPPNDIAFTAHRFLGDPLRANNNAVLIVNLDTVDLNQPLIFELAEIEGTIGIHDGLNRITVRATPEQISHEQNVARIVVPFHATGWGQNAVLNASTVRKDGQAALASCKLKFERPVGDQKFSQFVYDDLGRLVLGDVADDKIYINSGYPLHRQIFGDTEEDFNKSLETDPMAQVRAVSVVVETAVFHAATAKYFAGGKKGLHINSDDPIGSLRPYMDQSKIKLEPRVYQALVKKTT